jgi:hypothetical protein
VTGELPEARAAVYHKDLVRAVFPGAVARVEGQGRPGAVYLYSGPGLDDRPIGGGFDEDEAWITAALALAMEEGTRAMLGLLRPRGEGADRVVGWESRPPG